MRPARRRRGGPGGAVGGPPGGSSASDPSDGDVPTWSSADSAPSTVGTSVNSEAGASTWPSSSAAGTSVGSEAGASTWSTGDVSACSVGGVFGSRAEVGSPGWPSAATGGEVGSAPWAWGSVGVTIRDDVIAFLLCVVVLGACASVVMTEVRSESRKQPSTGDTQPARDGDEGQHGDADGPQVDAIRHETAGGRIDSGEHGVDDTTGAGVGSLAASADPGARPRRGTVSPPGLGG